MSQPVTVSTPLGTLIRNVPTGRIGRLTGFSEEHKMLGWKVIEDADATYGGTEFFEICESGHPYVDDGSDPGNCSVCHFYHR